MVKYLIILLFNLILISYCKVDWSMNDTSRDKWNNLAIDRISLMLNRKLNGNIAKNIIFFLGDGMGINLMRNKTVVNYFNKIF